MLFGKYLNKYYIKYGLLFLGGIIALILVDIAQMHIPPFLGEVVRLLDEGASLPGGINEEIIHNVIVIAHYTLIIAAMMFVGRVIFRFTIFSASHKIEKNIRQEMFLKAEKLPISYYHDNPVGNIMSWFTNDLEVIQDFLGWGTVMMVDAIFMSSLAVYRLFDCHWQLALISIIPISLIVVWGLLVEKSMSSQWEFRQKAYDRLYDFTQENFTGIRVIKAFVKENQQVLSFGKIARRNKEVNITFVRMNTIFDVVIHIIINSISSIIIGFGGWFIISMINGTPIVMFGQPVELDAPTLVTFAGYFEMLIWPMIALGQIVAMFSRARISLKRISNFLDADIEVKNTENPITLKDVKGKINFNNFSFYYKNDKNPALDRINLTINPGEKIGVVGKVGCGKTTLMNALMRIYNVNKGMVLIDGVDIMDCDLRSLRENISYVPQDNFLFSDKIKNNISFSDGAAKEEEIEEAARFACVHEDIKGFTSGYDTISGERGVTLSGGQKQRISIARAFLKNSPILIMDDSVSAVDTKTEETIINNINEYRKDKTTILIASRVSTVSHLDKIIVLNSGRLEAFGTHDELVKTSKTYQSMVLLQELEKEKGGI